MGDLDGRLLVRWRPLQYVRRVTGRRQDCPGGCVRHRMPAASGEPVLRAAETARQNRHYDVGQEAHRSPTRSEHGRELQTPGYDRADTAAKIAVSFQLSAFSF